MLLKTVPTETAPFEFMLITTYKNKEQFNKREENFQPMMAAGGELRLLNDKQPPEFRKTLFYVDGVSR